MWHFNQNIGSSFPNNRSPILPSSIDSAVESWNSSHQDLTSSPDHQKSSRDSHGLYFICKIKKE